MRFIFKTKYEDDLQLFKHRGQVFWYGLLVLGLLAAPFSVERFYLGELAFVFIYAIAGLGLMLLVGYTGLVSLGHAAFLAIGAYAHAYFLTKGWPLALSLSAATAISALMGGLVGIPALRMVGIYLAIATLAFAVIVEQVANHWDTVTGGSRGTVVEPVEILGRSVTDPVVFYFLCLGILVLSLLAAINVLRSSVGRAMVAVRDSEIAARSVGINLAGTKTIAFALSAGFTGLAGGLLAHRIGYLAPDSFTLNISIQLLLLVVVGGLGSLHGVLFGAIFVGLLPQGIAILRDSLPDTLAQMPGLEPGIFGLILILFLMFEPTGIYGQWKKIRQFFQQFPLYRKAAHKRQKAYLRTGRIR